MPVYLTKKRNSLRISISPFDIWTGGMRLLPLVKNIKRYFSLKVMAIILLALTVSVVAGVAIFNSNNKRVVINYNEERIEIKTMKTTVEEVLVQCGMKVSEHDFISLPLETKLTTKELNILDIKTAVPVNILADGREVQFMTYKQTVEEALQDSPVKISTADRLEGAKPEDKVKADMKIKIVRVKSEMVSEKEPVSYSVIRRPNSRMDKGEERVVEDGKEGQREKLYSVIYEDGKQRYKILVGNAVVEEPVSKVVEYGTIAKYTTSRGDSFRYQKVLDMKATAYTASYKDTGKGPGDPGFGITYTGVKAKRGIIAVDPRVIPLGTRVYIEGVGSTPTYGYAVAADIGSAIKGNKIDLYLDDQSEVDRWGVKKVKVYILY